MSPLSRFVKCWFTACFVALFAQSLASELRAETRKSATVTVQPGDALSLIAEKRRVSLALMRKVNGLDNADQIRPGQVLLLPQLHKVQRGDVLGTIAERYGVRLSALYRHNALNENSVLRAGQQIVIPGGKYGQRAQAKKSSESSPSKAVSQIAAKSKAKRTSSSKPKAKPKVEYYRHKVRRNDVLSTIAKRYAVSTRQLSELNGLGRSSLIRLGQRLKIPVNERNRRITRPGPPKPWKKYARKNFRRGYVTLKTPSRKWSGQVVNRQGKLLPQARQRVHGMLGSSRIQFSERLVRMIVLVSDEFGGRPIRVVSGYRKHSYSRHSKHPIGRALDFSIPGVPNTAVVDFLLTLPNTGVGYYPNSTHVHMDARSYKMHWVDVSGPGQRPRYVFKSTNGERAPTAKQRAAKRKLAKNQPRKRPRRSARSGGEKMASLGPRPTRPR